MLYLELQRASLFLAKAFSAQNIKLVIKYRVFSAPNNHRTTRTWSLTRSAAATTDTAPADRDHELRSSLRGLVKNNCCDANYGLVCALGRRYAFSESKSRRSAVLVAAALTGAILIWVQFHRIFVPTVHASAFPEDGSGDGVRASQRWNFIADVVDKAGPAVVYIEIQARHRFTNRMMAVSNGSGFIVRPDGLILTNAHVVGNSSTVRCRLQDGRMFDGAVQAVDPISDLATVKISAVNLPTLKLGDSSHLRPGEWVIAMGSPFQLSNTVTAGIISSAMRGSKELGIHNKDINYIQTDATINFGNSGGPLVNLDGEAIGINTMMVTTGISFAIPSDYAMKFLQKVESVEKRADSSKSWFGAKTTQRGYIGITMLSLTDELITTLRQRHPDFPDVDHGVLVHKVAIGSPAYHAGVQPGDIITQINDGEVREASDIYNALEKTTQLLITVQRGLDTRVISVTPEVIK